MDRKKKRAWNCETLGDRQQSPRQVPPVGIFFWEGGGGLKIGGRLPNQSPSFQQSSSARSGRQTGTCNRHNPLVLCQCHVMSCRSCRVVSCQVNWQGGRDQSRAEQYGCARYSQLIRIIECQACGTEGTEWRRRGPLSLCVRPLSGNAWVFRSLCVSEPVIVSVSASVFLHVLIVTRDGCSSTGHGRAGRLCGCWARTQLRNASSCSWSSVSGNGWLRAPRQRRRGGLAEERVETRG